MKSIVDEEKLASDAYERVEPDWAALHPHQLLRVDLDVPIVAQTILGALPQLRPFRAQIAELPTINVAELDRLKEYALALLHADARYVMLSQPPKDLTALGLLRRPCVTGLRRTRVRSRYAACSTRGRLPL